MRISLLGRAFGCLHKFKKSNLTIGLRAHPFAIAMSTDVGPAPMTDIVPSKESLATPITARADASAGTKRLSDSPVVGAANGSTDLKKARTEDPTDESCMGYARPFYQKRKVAMLIVYSGKGYTGMQMNPGMKTIEQDLMDALLKAGVVTEDHISKPGIKMGFQRAARTDKGVSASGQLVSLKMFVDVEKALEKINSHLVDQIRVIGFKRVTRGFSSKDSCSSRTYIYVIPTFAFTPVEEFVTENFHMTAALREEVNRVLAFYKGTHKFHNFTSGKKLTDPSSQRYIIEMQIGEPFMTGDIEYAVISVKGQSFMLHQIRKMIGLAIAIVRGLASDKSIEYSWRPEKADVPMAPSLGLVLDKLHFDAYNKRFGSDGQHESIEWNEFKEEIEAFKHKHIFSTIFETELKEKSMLKWLATLHNHHFETRKSDKLSAFNETKLGQAANNIWKVNHGIVLGDEEPVPSAEDSSDTPSNINIEPTGGATVDDVHDITATKPTDEERECDIKQELSKSTETDVNSDVTKDVTSSSINEPDVTTTSCSHKTKPDSV